jgi:dTDP-4-dehydrorhamnose reductase
MRILLLGADGQVGFELQRSLAPLGELAIATRRGVVPGNIACLHVDLATPNAVIGAIETVQPDWVVNAAAWTAVDRAEDEPAAARVVNADALAVIGAAARQRGARVLHFSTDYVFPGDAARPYREDDATGPIGAYGLSKLAGERELAASGCAHVILRTAWVYGARGRNFLRTMLRLGAERERLTVVDDQHGCPTTARLVADAAAQVLARHAACADPRAAGLDGVFHLVSRGQTSWHGFATAIFERAHRAGLLARMPEVVAVGSSAYPTRARRPAWSVLDTQRIRETYGLHLPHWQQGLDAVIGEIAAQREGNEPGAKA